MTSARDHRGDAALALTVLTWASAFPAIEVGLRGYSPWALGLLRLLVAAAVLAPVAAIVRPARPRGAQWGRVLACGLVGQTLYQGLLMTGEQSIPPGTASVLIATAPIFSVLAAAGLLHEPIGGRWKGFAVAFLGAGLVGASAGVGGGPVALVVLAAALCQGLYHVLAKPLAEQLGAFSATIWSAWAGTALALPALPMLLSDATDARAGSTAAAVFLGVVPSALGFLVWSAALRRSSVARSTVSLYLVPVVAMAVSWSWLGERPTPLAVLGGAVAIAGVVLVRRTSVAKPAAPGQPADAECPALPADSVTQ